ncbi:MAG TPA: 3'(2'),5'-bisphosphate nucleotidase [Polyangiaceae bacterium]|nr:3'(2'),5'-bisphosphate nucleotidase [Polyangiaceae bacterium]
MTQWSADHEFAVQSVRLAGQLCASLQPKIAGEAAAKQDKSPVTVADFASQALIGDALRREFPNDPVVGEEDSTLLRAAENEALLQRVCAALAGQLPRNEQLRSQGQVLSAIDWGSARVAHGRRWTLDPIDGTKGFLRGGQYAVALALLQDGEVNVAALACPNLSAAWGLGVVFSAARGTGAFAQPLHTVGEPQLIAVSARGEPEVEGGAESVRICESVESGHSDHQRSRRLFAGLRVGSEVLRVDSQTKYGMVAQGSAEAYCRLPTSADYHEKIWDHAAGVLIVREAGGTVTDIEGRALDFTQGHELRNNRGVVVTNGHWHLRLLQAIAHSQ